MLVRSAFFYLFLFMPLIANADDDTKSTQNTTSVISAKQAKQEEAGWGNALTYYSGATFGTKDGLWAVATIKPGEEIHPPHKHEEEEFMMVMAGNGTWHLNGKEFPANTGDTMYAQPWDIHGIRNTGSEPLKFVVWKWSNKGLPAPKDN